MVSTFSALLHAINAMKNTIDDADYIINRLVFIVINQCIVKYAHSHSIVNEHEKFFIFNAVFAGVCTDTMKNTMFRNSSKMLEKIADRAPPYGTLGYLPGFDF